MKVGYVRVSTQEQETARQEVYMQSVDVEKIFLEKASGKTTDGRAELKAMLDYVREGDTLYIESISRLARSTRDFLGIMETLDGKGVTVVSAKENIDTSNPQGRFMLTIFAAMAELEREQTLQRQREGIEIAKAQGKYKGRKRIEADASDFERIYKTWKSGEITGKKAMEKLEMKPNTFYRRVKEYENSVNSSKNA